MTEPYIQREETANRGRYWVELEGHLAEMTYSRLSDAKIMIDHTVVPLAFRGSGLARKLVERGVLDARAEGRKIIPLCSYVQAQIAKTPEWQDVVAAR